MILSFTQNLNNMVFDRFFRVTSVLMGFFPPWTDTRTSFQCPRNAHDNIFQKKKKSLGMHGPHACAHTVFPAMLEAATDEEH